MTPIVACLTVWFVAALAFYSYASYATGFLFLVVSLVCAFVIFYMLLMQTKDPTLRTLAQRYWRPTRSLPVSAKPWSPDLVIARYNESLSWLPGLVENPKFRPNVFVYSKCKDSLLDPKIRAITGESIELANVGREAHTFLTHVVRNYDHLAPLTIFTMGTVDVAGRWVRFSRLLKERFGTNKDGIVGMRWPSIRELHSNFKREEHEGKRQVHANVRPWTKWADQKFGAGVDHTMLTCNSMLCASRESIRARPKKFYEDLVQELAEAGCDTELGHFMERAWPLVFSFAPDALIEFVKWSPPTVVTKITNFAINL